MLAEYAPAKRRGLVASIIAIGSNSGTLLASLVWLLVLQLDKEYLMSWGWRIPFIASILIAGAALSLRRHVRETPVFERELQQNHQRMLDASAAAPDNRSYLQSTKAFWVMLGLRIGENGPSYLCQGFIVDYLAKVLMVDNSVPPLAVLIASLCGFLVIPLAGWLPAPVAAIAIGELICNNPGEITLAAIGPLTNVAHALQLYPQMAQAVKEIVIMGGVFNVEGYIKDTNFGLDPEAARLALGWCWAAMPISRWRRWTSPPKLC